MEKTPGRQQAAAEVNWEAKGGSKLPHSKLDPWREPWSATTRDSPLSRYLQRSNQLDRLRSPSSPHVLHLLPTRFSKTKVYS
jgi:hypothetical protein